jgi:hypothetical protein
MRLVTGFFSLCLLSANAAFAAVENGTADDGAACSATPPMMTAGTGCRATPSKYEVTIYEMGVCTEDPFGNHQNTTMDKTSCSVVFTNTSGFTNDYGATIGQDVTMTGTSTRPANGTYKYPYMVIKNEFIVNGSFTSNGVTYYSTGSGNAATTGTAADYTDTLTNFGGPNCVSGYPNAEIAGVGTISAYLVNASLERPDASDRQLINDEWQCTGINRLVGLMNLTTPFTISDATIGFGYNFVLTDLGIQFYDDENDDSIPEGFGSSPFSGKFTITDR